MNLLPRLLLLFTAVVLAAGSGAGAAVYLDAEPPGANTQTGYTSLTYNHRWDQGTQVSLGGGVEAGWVDYCSAGAKNRNTTNYLLSDFYEFAGSVVETVRIAGLQAGSYDLTLYGLDQSYADKRTLFQVDQDNDGVTDVSGTVDTTASQQSVTLAVTVSAAGVLKVTIQGTSGRSGAFNGLDLVETAPPNAAPTVDAGSNQTIVLPTNTASLDGTVSDDGLPDPPAAVTTAWTKVSGPGTVTFGDASAVDTTATFSTHGAYVLQLEASDGALSTTDTVTITVDPEPLPTVAFNTTASSGNEAITTVQLAVSLSDAYDSGTVTVNYAVTGGTAVNPDDYSIAGNQLTFNPGVTQQNIVLTIVDDAVVEPDETVEVTLSNPANATLGANTVHTYTIVNDDTGGAGVSVYLDAQGAGGTTAAGYTAITHNNRWDQSTQVAIGGGIEAGWVDYVSAGAKDRGMANDLLTDFYEFGSGVVESVRITGLDAGGYDLTLYGWDNSWPNKKTFFAVDQDNDGVTDVSGTVDNTASQQSVTLSVNVSAAGVLKITIQGTSGASGAFNGLDLEGTGGPTNAAPTVDAGSNAAITLPTDTVNLDGTVTDDGLPNPPGVVTTTWTKVSGPGTVTFGDASAVDTTATFSTDGVYVLQLEASDSALSASDTVTVTVNPAASAPIVSGELKKWHAVTVTFDGPMTGEGETPNPFRDYRLQVTFTAPSSATHEVPGYYAANGNAAETSATDGSKWRVHFVPDEVGTWTFSASFRTGTDIAMDLIPSAGTSAGYCDGSTGQFTIAATDKTGSDFRGKGMLRYVGQRYLQFAETGEYFLKGGANSPENFLAYGDFDDTTATHAYVPHANDWTTGDPTWQGGKGKNIVGALNYLANKGMNAVYFLTMNVTGDGDDVWPWTSRSERYRFDCSKLDQWEIVFSHMDKLGLQLHVVTQEIENDHLLDGGALGSQRKLYYRELVARFGHHLAVVWNLGEENRNTDAQRKAFATRFKALDPYNHPVACHTWPGETALVYNPLRGYPDFDMVSLQVLATHSETITWIDESANYGHQWVVCLDEVANANSGVVPDANDYWHNSIRKDFLWANLMAGGGGCEWYFGYNYAHNDLNCEDWRSRDHMWDLTRIALDFFQTHIPFHTMSHNDGLTSASDDFVLAAPGQYYAIYLPNGGTTNVTLLSGTYQVKWYDPRNGGFLQDGTVTSINTAGGSEAIGQAPNSTSSDWVCLLTNAGIVDVIAPATVTDLAAGTVTDTSVDLTWTAPGDDGTTGTASSYDVRYSTAVITEANWWSATQATGEPTPAAAGSAQGMTVSGLSAGTTYYFAIKTSDEVPNISALSNVVSAATTGQKVGAEIYLDAQPPTGALATNYAALTYQHRWDNGTQIFLNWGVQAGWVDYVSAGAKDRQTADPLLADFYEFSGSTTETVRITGLPVDNYQLTLYGYDPSYPNKNTIFTIDQDNDGVTDHTVTINNGASQQQATVNISVSAAGILTITIAGNGTNGAFNGLDLIGAGGTPLNNNPTVDAGPDQEISLPTNTVNLDGTVTDDGLPDPPGAVTTTWSKVSGPGTVTFGDASAVDTTAAFSAAGSYVLQLQASDGALGASDTVTITVNPEPLVLTVNTTAGQGTFENPYDTRGEFMAWGLAPDYHQQAPFIEHYLLFNAFGCAPGRPERELYDEDQYGNPVYHFHRTTNAIDSILAQGMLPYITVGGCPVKLASDPNAVSTAYGTMTCRPSDYNKYRAFVQAFFEDLNTKYGAQNVATWRFKMMTEPDNVDWWSESRNEWFTFYAETVAGAAAANPGVVINPGNLMRHRPGEHHLWLVPWAQQVHAGNLPVPRRITFSFYSPWTMPNTGGPQLLYDDIPSIRQALAPYPELDNIPIGLDEGYIGRDEQGKFIAGHMDGTELGAAHVVLLTQAGLDMGLDSMMIWHCEFNDPPMAPRMVIDWVYGLDQQTRLVPQVTAGSMLTDHYLGTFAARDAAGTVTAVVSHWARYRNATGTTTYSIRLTNLPPGPVNVHHTRIDRDHGIYAHQWISDSASIPRWDGWSVYGCYPFAWELQNDPNAMAIWNANVATYWNLVNSSNLGTTGMTVGADGVLTIDVSMPPQSASKFVVTPQ